MKTYLFDTNILLYFFRQDKNWDAIKARYNLAILQKANAQTILQKIRKNVHISPTKIAAIRSAIHNPR